MTEDMKEPDLITGNKQRKSFVSKAAGQALGLGAIAGVRATIAPAIASDYMSKHPDMELASSRLKFMQSPFTAKITKLASTAEITGDKMPFMPDRISLPQLLVRIASGSLMGASVFIVNKEKIVNGVLIGGAAALCTTFISFYIRKYLSKIPYVKDYMIGALEDFAAIKLGISLMKH